jgi:hypothetical protein
LEKSSHVVAGRVCRVQGLIGAKLKGVTFVADHVQVHFDAAQLTANSLPHVELAGWILRTAP